MSHDELRALLAPYATADLDMAEAAVVRAHLSECRECLRAILVRPAAPPRALDHALRGSRPGQRRGLVAALAAALAAAGLGAWTIANLRPHGVSEMNAYLTELESARGRLAARLGRLERKLRATRSAASRQGELPATGGETPPESTTLPPARLSARSIRYANDLLSVSVVDVPLHDILGEISRESGVVIRGELNPDRDVSAEFENVTLPEALDRLLGGRNFVLVYDQGRRPRVVQLLSAPRVAAEAPASGETPSARTERSLLAVLGLLDAHPAAALGGKLAGTLGTEAMSLRQLVDTGLHHPYRTIRARAMRRFLAELQSDADLQSAMLGTLAGMDDAALGELVRNAAGERAEEMLFYMATQASGELRARAAALLEQLHTGADIVQPASRG